MSDPCTTCPQLVEQNMRLFSVIEEAIAKGHLPEWVREEVIRYGCRLCPSPDE